MQKNGFWATVKDGLHVVGHWLKPYWQRFSAVFGRQWHRLQLTRWVIIAILSLILVVSAYLTFEAKTAKVGNLQAELEKTTEIFDKDNKRAGSLYSQKGTYVHLSAISTNLQNAVISTEDRNFYSEHGFSIKGIGRAGVLYVMNKLLRRNYISGGGSTLTQQLVKNAFLTQQQTFTRKLREIFLSIEVENVYTKSQILAMYLNNAYFGHGVWGAEDAAERYFGVHASELSVDQAATLAGMLSSPSGYDPITHPKASTARRNVVLNNMVNNKKLSQSEYQLYSKKAMTLADNYHYESGYNYPYYFDAVISEAINKYGLTESDIMNRGYKIYTSLDQDDQTQMQTSFKDSTLFPANADDGTKVQGASIAVDPTTGGVLAVVGGRGKHVFRGYNRATQIERQPGSTIKPLAVYTPALESGYTYDSKLSNKQQTFGANKYAPKNYDSVYSTSVPMYSALAQSMNIPAVWLLNKIGVNKGYKSVKKFGLSVRKGDDNLALALGGLTTGVSPSQMASAYTAFANGGKKTSSHFITKIVDASGKTIVDNTTTKSKRIMSASVAKEMTSMMLGVYNSGTGAAAKPYGYTIAGKTGSTQADYATGSGTKDQWMIAYTPDVVVTTWIGFDTTNSTHYLKSLSENQLSALFKSEMTNILPNTKGTSFGTQDASTLAQQSSANNSSDSSTNVWNNVQEGANKVGQTVKDTAKNWFSQAKKLIGN
ncbi:PBP1A family penicillin-binding protein [Lactiplantibacillus sp. WILCCON 0030]|uniref:PBP1A family penicillin-binding protein n=1 Tax=Lactiplantibacillus brownii TaxID=3069269 RepID=A0ABU1A881_9LACO|nr:PBP1A family penicillin-binding protein [Lactiplantibacillus brownii]MDQ7937163.1 PBP1A family penicillin-binding protein [Lactiplantibacillus brownii]